MSSYLSKDVIRFGNPVSPATGGASASPAPRKATDLGASSYYTPIPPPNAPLVPPASPRRGYASPPAAAHPTDLGGPGYWSAIDYAADPRFNPPTPPDGQADAVIPSMAPIGCGDGRNAGDANQAGAPGVDTDQSFGFPVSYPRDEHLHQTVDKCREALLAAHQNEARPHVYNLDGSCAILEDNKDGKKIRVIANKQANLGSIKDILSRSMAFFVRTNGDDPRPIPPANDAAHAILASPAGLPKLTGIVNVPTLRHDGTIIEKPGYDPETGLYYDPAGLGEIHVPEKPTPDDLDRALVAIKRPFEKFPFKTTSDWANYLGLLLTPIVRDIIDGNVPLNVIDAPLQGTGKSKLASCVSLIATGEARPMTIPERAGDDELRKRITAELAGRPRVTIFDNLAGKLDSPSLAAALTTGIWSDRRLQQSDMMSLPVRTTFIATGVNVEAAGDMSRRCVWTQLDPGSEKPWERRFGFDPEVYVRRRRAELAGALLTLARNWFAKGKPGWGGTPIGSFEAWTDVVGGILQAAGICGFLENRDRFDNAANQELEALAVFYQAWNNVFSGAGQRSMDVVGLLNNQGSADSARGVMLRDALLEEMLPILDKRNGGAAIRLGGILRKYKNRPAGGLMLVATQDPRSHSLVWTVVPDNMGKAGSGGRESG